MDASSFIDGATPNEKPVDETLSLFLVSVVDEAVTPKLKPAPELVTAGVCTLAELAPTGFAASQHGHFANLSSFVTEHVGHFHVPGATCMNRARGLDAPLAIGAGADLLGAGLLNAELLLVGFAVSQHGHFENLSWLVTEQLGHFHVPGTTCMKRASGLVPVDAGTLDTCFTGLFSTIGADTGSFGFTDFGAHSAFCFGDGGTKEKAASVPLGFDDDATCFGGSRRADGSENSK